VRHTIKITCMTSEVVKPNQGGRPRISQGSYSLLVRVSKQLKTRLEQTAHFCDTTISEIVRLAVDEWLQDKIQGKPESGKQLEKTYREKILLIAKLVGKIHLWLNKDFDYGNLSDKSNLRVTISQKDKTLIYEISKKEKISVSETIEKAIDIYLQSLIRFWVKYESFNDVFRLQQEKGIEIYTKTNTLKSKRADHDFFERFDS
jgi:hypothetical protein